MLLERLNVLTFVNVLRNLGIQCPHRGAVYSFTWRHRAYPYENDDREACNVFFIWEMIRPLLKGEHIFILII